MSDQQEKVESPAEELKKALEETSESEVGEKVSEEKREESQPEAFSEPTLEVQLQSAKEEAAKHYDLYIRAAAEMENTRRRCAQDVMKARLFGIESFAKNLLPVIDSLEKALESVREADESIRQGLETTMKQLTHALEVSGMTSIDPQNQPFDPALAQAIAMVPADDAHPAGTVVAVFQKGWKLNDRVLRAAMVSVAQ